MTARLALVALSLVFAGGSLAQTPKPATPLPPVKPAAAEEKLPAKLLFSQKKLPSLGRAMAIGFYPRGCLQGGVELPVDGPNWQVMRLSRNRNWGHPELVKFLERFARLAAKATGWHGILVGDMAQPRGGPLPFGHASHQIGLDVDIWFMPMPNHKLSPQERENISASNLVAPDKLHVDLKTWTPADVAFIRTAAEQPEVERIFVNAAIKKELCRVEGKNHFSWMSRVRP
jgi:penicillin-insensitive murein endopeptidase